jgi:hypothetical protein
VRYQVGHAAVDHREGQPGCHGEVEQALRTIDPM